MQYHINTFSHKGRKKDNEDAYLTIDLGEDQYLLAIADGVGGREGGNLASSTAIKELSNYFSQNKFTNMSVIFNRIKDSIINEGNKQNYPKMATTLTVCYINNNEVTVGHVGDCRLYHIRGNGLITKTRDQSEKQKLIDDGIFSKERALFYPRKNILLSVIAKDHEYELYETEFQINQGDRLLLISDGVYNLCSKKEIVELSSKNNFIENWLNDINSLITLKIPKDDYTAIAFEMK